MGFFIYMVSNIIAINPPPKINSWFLNFSAKIFSFTLQKQSTEMYQLWIVILLCPLQQQQQNLERFDILLHLGQYLFLHI